MAFGVVHGRLFWSLMYSTENFLDYQLHLFIIAASLYKNVMSFTFPPRDLTFLCILCFINLGNSLFPYKRSGINTLLNHFCTMGVVMCMYRLFFTTKFLGILFIGHLLAYKEPPTWRSSGSSSSELHWVICKFPSILKPQGRCEMGFFDISKLPFT